MAASICIIGTVQDRCPKDEKYMKKDCVLDENNQTVSLAEYNYRHNTDYTLDDVYGKGYVESLTEKSGLVSPQNSRSMTNRRRFMRAYQTYQM